MNNKLIILSLTAIVVVASGCTDTEDEGSEGKESITVHDLEVAPKTAYEGTTVTSELEIVNEGELPARIDVGERGVNVLSDYCPDVFKLSDDDFQVSPEDHGIRGQENVYELNPGEGLTMQWDLSQEGEVPLYGKRCNLNFQVPFQYSVSAYRQVQLKNSESVQGSDLTWESSTGPLSLAIETLGGTGEEGESTYVLGEDDQMTALLQLQNLGREGVSKGVIDIDESTLQISFDLGEQYSAKEGFKKDKQEYCKRRGYCVIVPTGTSGDQKAAYSWQRIESEGIAADQGSTACQLDFDNPLRMFEGTSRVIDCNVTLTEFDQLSSPSVIGNVEATVNYTYMKQVGSKDVEVKYRR